MVAAVQAVMPDAGEAPWRFRIASSGMQAVPWSTLGFSFGTTVERPLQPRRDPA